MHEINDWLATTWGQDRAVVVAGATLLGLVLLGVAALWMRVTGKPVRPAVIWAVSNLALVANAEGTWTVLTGPLRQTPAFAALIVGVFEFALIRAMSLAAVRYEATCMRDGEGKLTAGHPGKALYVVWLIALGSGSVIALNAPTWTERVFRILLPTIVVLLWWTALTAEGQSTRRSRFAYSPSRLMERWGWLTAVEDSDLRLSVRQRQIRSAVTHGYRARVGGRLATWHRGRLKRLALGLDDEAVAEIRSALVRAERVIGLLSDVDVEDLVVEVPVVEEPAAGGGLVDVILLAQEAAEAKVFLLREDVLQGAAAEALRVQREADAAVQRIGDAALRAVQMVSAAAEVQQSSAAAQREAQQLELPQDEPVQRPGSGLTADVLLRDEAVEEALRGRFGASRPSVRGVEGFLKESGWPVGNRVAGKLVDGFWPVESSGVSEVAVNGHRVAGAAG